MVLIVAPAEKTFTVVPQGVYEASVIGCKPEDHTTIPDNFGNTGFWNLTFRWELWGPESEDGSPVVLLHTIKFQTGTYLAKKGARPGHMPWLTEYTRAMGMADLLPNQTVDTDIFLGKRARLHVLLDVDGDLKERNKINGISPTKGESKSISDESAPTYDDLPF